jgi:hypothetical protein
MQPKITLLMSPGPHSGPSGGFGGWSLGEGDVVVMVVVLNAVRGKEEGGVGVDI